MRTALYLVFVSLKDLGMSPDARALSLYSYFDEILVGGCGKVGHGRRSKGGEDHKWKKLKGGRLLI